jgi:hypothetical protein
VAADLSESTKERNVSAREGVVPLSHFREADLAEITRWGPESTTVGEPFNVQADGNSAFWFEAYLPSSDLVVFLGEMQLSTARDRRSMTASPTTDQLEELIRKPGRYRLYAVSLLRKKKQKIGNFEVKEAAGASTDRHRNGKAG